MNIWKFWIIGGKKIGLGSCEEERNGEAVSKCVMIRWQLSNLKNIYHVAFCESMTWQYVGHVSPRFFPCDSNWAARWKSRWLRGKVKIAFGFGKVNVRWVTDVGPAGNGRWMVWLLFLDFDRVCEISAAGILCGVYGYGHFLSCSGEGMNGPIWKSHFYLR